MPDRTVVLLAIVFAAASHAADTFSLRSTDIAAGSRIAEAHVYNGFGCNGTNRSPALSWSNAPAGTKSFALTVYDPDAPTGSGWWHWVVVNIAANVTALPAGAGEATGKALPEGAMQVRTDFGKSGYGGPCPPAGDKPHRYVFTLHALKTEKLDLAPDATAAMAGFMVNANQIGKATFTGTYGR